MRTVPAPSFVPRRSRGREPARDVGYVSRITTMRLDPMPRILQPAAIALSLAIAASTVHAQTTPPRIAATNQDLFTYLDMPTPTSVRLGSGAPGPGYWQNRADYTNKATLDTTQHRITGSETIHYTN